MSLQTMKSFFNGDLRKRLGELSKHPKTKELMKKYEWLEDYYSKIQP